MEDRNCISIQSWMRTELDLKGNDLLIYAIIYGFSQDGKSTFSGGLQYLADWCGCTKQGALKNLKSLVDKGLIQKIEINKNGIKFCEYVVNTIKHSLTPEFNSIKHSLTNNIYNNIYNNTTNNKPNTVKKKKEKSIKRIVGSENEDYQYIADAYNSICTNLSKTRVLTDKRKQTIKHLLKAYDIETIKQAFEKANESSFLTGHNDRGWKADLDFILREDKFVNILEGKYDNYKSKSNRKKFGENDKMEYTRYEGETNGKKIYF